MATITTGGVKLSFNFMHGKEAAAMRGFAIGPVSELQRRLHLYLVRVTVCAERTLVAGRTEAVIGCSIETMIFNK
jgi:hypothetical protein